MKRITLTAPRFWYRPRSFLSDVLSPLSLFYRIGVAAHRCLYAVGVKKIQQFSVPVVVVGNVTVGGSGKTPLVIWLANELKKGGFYPGLVSRGYGGQINRFPQVVTANSNPRKVGDEAVLLAIKTRSPIAVCRDRSAAVHQLVKNFRCDIVISDDGLQHYALGRAVEIVLIDDRGLGNERCLPAGPLREPISRLKTVDFVVTKKLRPIEIYQLENSKRKISFKELKNLTVHAVAGVGNPENFFQQLKLLGANVIEHSFPDHYFFQAKDFYFSDSYPIILTEKDAVKCKSFNNKYLFCLSVDAIVSNQFQQSFSELISTVLSVKPNQLTRKEESAW